MLLRDSVRFPNSHLSRKHWKWRYDQRDIRRSDLSCTANRVVFPDNRKQRPSRKSSATLGGDIEEFYFGKNNQANKRLAARRFCAECSLRFLVSPIMSLQTASGNAIEGGTLNTLVPPDLQFPVFVLPNCGGDDLPPCDQASFQPFINYEICAPPNIDPSTAALRKKKSPAAPLDRVPARSQLLFVCFPFARVSSRR